MSRTQWFLTLVGIAIVALIAWRVVTRSGLTGKARVAGADAPPVPVTVVPVATSDVPIYLMGQGTVTPINTVNVQPQVDGQLLKLDFVEGKPVKKGQLLAQIDPRTLEAQLNQGVAKRAQDETQLQTAQANLERSENPKYAQYVAEIDRITQKNTVAQWQAAVAADNAAIASTKVQLGFTRIISPIKGVAGLRQVDPGNVVTTATTIVTVTQMHPIDVIFTLAGKYLDEVRTAQANAPLQVAILDADDNVVENDGVLQVINNQIDPSTNTFQLKAEFPNAHGQLYPGQFANTRLEVGVDAGALVVPTAAVQRGPNGGYVWQVTDQPPADPGPTGDRPARAHVNGKPDKPDKPGTPTHYAEMQAVTTGAEAGNSGTIITAGLQAGDLVVTAGQFRLKQGSKVNPMKPGQVPAPPTTAEIKAAAQLGGRGRRR